MHLDNLKLITYSEGDNFIAKNPFKSTISLFHVILKMNIGSHAGTYFEKCLDCFDIGDGFAPLAIFLLVLR